MSYDPYVDPSLLQPQQPYVDPSLFQPQQPFVDPSLLQPQQPFVGTEWDPVAGAWRAGPPDTEPVGSSARSDETCACVQGEYCRVHDAWHM